MRWPNYREWGVRPSAMLGYSLGEYVAACLSGVLSLDDALLLVARRAQLIEQLPHGAMLAVALSETDAQPYIDEQINLAVINGPAISVLAGPVTAIEQLEARLHDKEIACRRVETTHAFHSSMLETIQEELTSLVSNMTLRVPQIPYISNVTGTWITAEQATNPAYWAQHMCQTVRFSDGVSHLLQETEHLLLEVGAGQSLCSFVKMHPACDRECMLLVFNTLPMPYEQRSDAAYMLAVLGKLWLQGVSLDWHGVYADEKRQRLSLPTYPFERQRYWLEARKHGNVLQQVKHVGEDELERITNMAGWFSVPAWKQAFRGDIQAENELQEVRNWLICLDTCGIGNRIIDFLQQHGQQVITVKAGISFSVRGSDVYTIQPDKKSDYESLFKDLRSQGRMPTRIIHLWTITHVERAVACLKKRLTLAFIAYLRWLRRWAIWNWKHAISLLFPMACRM